MAQGRMIIDFAVEDDPDILLLVGQRLMPGLDVDNAQPPHGQAEVFFDEIPFVIRPAMRDAPVHARQRTGLNPPITLGEKNTANSAHIRPASSKIERKPQNSSRLQRFLVGFAVELLAALQLVGPAL